MTSLATGGINRVGLRDSHQYTTTQGFWPLKAAGSVFLLRREGVGESKKSHKVLLLKTAVVYHIEGNNEERYVPFDFPKTRGLDVDNRGFFNGDWLSRSFSVSA